MHPQIFKRAVIPIGVLICFLPFISAWMALISGVIVALTIGNAYRPFTKIWVPRLLSLAIIGLGAGMNLQSVWEVGKQGVVYTFFGIFLTLGIGVLLGRVFRTDKNTSILLSVGTAICGGSAIAAISPVIGAKDDQITLSLAVVFILNALALLIFPWIGHALEMDQHMFGVWSALAIHDTSSVVAASSVYGADAVQVATTVKLVRALWIIPLVILFQVGVVYGQRKSALDHAAVPIKYPWFILGFIAAVMMVTFIPACQNVGNDIAALSRHLLVVVLFLIGTNLSPDVLRHMGLRAFFHGVTLWLIVSTVTAAALLNGMIG